MEPPFIAWPLCTDPAAGAGGPQEEQKGLLYLPNRRSLKGVMVTESCRSHFILELFIKIGYLEIVMVGKSLSLSWPNFLTLKVEIITGLPYQVVLRDKIKSVLTVNCHLKIGGGGGGPPIGRWIWSRSLILVMSVTSFHFLSLLKLRLAFCWVSCTLG